MSEGNAEGIIRRCARLFYEPIYSEGTFLRQTNRKGYGARVELRVDLADPTASISVDCHGSRPTGRQGDIADVPAEGFNDWKQGAMAGVSYALARADQPSIGVTVTRVQGLVTDTNPTIVGAAAINAVWKALKFEPGDADVEHVTQMALASWDRPVDAIPEW